MCSFVCHSSGHLWSLIPSHLHLPNAAIYTRPTSLIFTTCMTPGLETRVLAYSPNKLPASPSSPCHYTIGGRGHNCFDREGQEIISWLVRRGYGEFTELQMLLEGGKEAGEGGSAGWRQKNEGTRKRCILCFWKLLLDLCRKAFLPCAWRCSLSPFLFHLRFVIANAICIF